ncbi:hypothetical protein CVD25_22175 [Bacillus canaveralius]|uniref:Yip1 domain-containing protein n=1 Tax=Bacillus canaveralius TaxID=1403243 RepID=A0A2N5GP81_9BACI|nr:MULTISPECIES: YIP1 family protein [Bacillus]PLR84373.1 hypothetical protein CU635_06325 [Bacillus canaveralius]PLR87044.1 hypothetical protein CVD23_05305 [Bacillus sp. V33-4]PLR88807.1 hypothetical protein CVD25_22175 [Bacillus canaveralius]
MLELRSNRLSNLLVFLLRANAIMAGIYTVSQIIFLINEHFYMDYAYSIGSFTYAFYLMLFFVIAVLFFIWIYRVHQDLRQLDSAYPLAPKDAAMIMIPPLSIAGLAYTYIKVARFFKKYEILTGKAGRKLLWLTGSIYGLIAANSIIRFYEDNISFAISGLLMILSCSVYLIVTRVVQKGIIVLASNEEELARIKRLEAEAAAALESAAEQSTARVDTGEELDVKEGPVEEQSIQVVKYPFLSILVKARLTIRQLTSGEQKSRVLPIAMLNGIITLFTSLISSEYPSPWSWFPTLMMIVLLGALAGIALLYIYGFLFFIAGKPIKGKASQKEIRTAYAWMNIPSFWAFFAWLPAIAFFPEQLFTGQLLTQESNIFLTLILLCASLFYSVGLCWSIVLLMIGLSEVQRFSIWKAILNILIAAIPFILIGIITAVSSVGEDVGSNGEDIYFEEEEAGLNSEGIGLYEEEDLVRLPYGYLAYNKIDYLGSSDLLSVDLARTYISDAHNWISPFGYGWYFSYYHYLEQQDEQSIGEIRGDYYLYVYELQNQSLASKEEYILPASPDYKLTKLAENAYRIDLPSGFQYTFNGVKSETDPDGGRLMSIHHQQGSAVSLEYDDKGRLTRAAKQDGTFAEFHYTGELITSVVDETGNEIRYEYLNNELRTVRFPDGASETYEYDAFHRLKVVHAVDGTTYEYSYEKTRNRVAGIKRNGHHLFSYKYLENEVVQYDAQDRKTRYIYDDNKNLIKTIDHNGREITN